MFSTRFSAELLEESLNRKIPKEIDSPSAMMDVDLSIDRHLHDFQPPSRIESESSSSTLSNSGIF